MVESLSKNLKVPVCCKIRILPDEKDTLDLCKKIEEAGCSILTVHGRTKEQNKHRVANCDWEIIKKIKENSKIPIFANGGVYTFDDVQACLEQTGVDGVMSAEALLENPGLFSGRALQDLDILAAEYLQYWKKYDGKNVRYIKPHLFKILHQGLKENTDLRSRLGAARKYEEYEGVIQELAERRKDQNLESKFGWYHRYRDYKKPDQKLPKKKRDEGRKSGKRGGLSKKDIKASLAEEGKGDECDEVKGGDDEEGVGLGKRLLPEDN